MTCDCGSGFLCPLHPTVRPFFATDRPRGLDLKAALDLAQSWIVDAYTQYDTIKASMPAVPEQCIASCIVTLSLTMRLAVDTLRENGMSPGEAAAIIEKYVQPIMKGDVH